MNPRLMNPSIASSDMPQWKNYNNLGGGRPQDMTDRVPFIIQYFPRAEKLCHVLRSLQHVIDNEHLSKIFPHPVLLAFKQLPNVKQTVVHSKLTSLQDNIDHSNTQPYHGNLYETCQINDMDTTITGQDPLRICP
eukprot:g34755.t1